MNVHPSKTEVRFRQQSVMHDFVRDSVRAALMKARPVPQFVAEMRAHATASQALTPGSMTPGAHPWEPSTGDGRVPASGLGLRKTGKLSRGPTTPPGDSHCTRLFLSPFQRDFNLKAALRSKRTGRFGRTRAGVGRTRSRFRNGAFVPCRGIDSRSWLRTAARCSR